MKMKRLKFTGVNRKQWIMVGMALTLTLMECSVMAQDPTAGINEANTQVRSFFTPSTKLMFAVGAILGIMGAVKVYQKWNAGDPNTWSFAAAWFGSCVFLGIVVTVIKSFFGL